MGILSSIQTSIHLSDKLMWLHVYRQYDTLLISGCVSQKSYLAASLHYNSYNNCVHNHIDLYSVHKNNWLLDVAPHKPADSNDIDSPTDCTTLINGHGSTQSYRQ